MASSSRVGGIELALDEGRIDSPGEDPMKARSTMKTPVAAPAVRELYDTGEMLGSRVPSVIIIGQGDVNEGV